MFNYITKWNLFTGAWRKASHDMPRGSSLNNQVSTNYENQTEQNYPWYWNYGQSCGSAVPQSPHCHYHHHMCMPSMNAPPTTNDPMLMQQFIQTQQMLINSISQCNQLLWDQQREINNLNSAVLLVSLMAAVSYNILRLNLVNNELCVRL